MYILLNTADYQCKLIIDQDGDRRESVWDAGRELAKDLLGYIQKRLSENNATLKDLRGIGVMQGPGSFTGLRIGMAVSNTLADSLNIPIVGVVGDNWADQATERLKNGENDKIVMPFYDRPVNITQPRK
jgi:tRNA threonylcarbamoyladenosine biosynthesis protein TsaB